MRHIAKHKTLKRLHYLHLEVWSGQYCYLDLTVLYMEFWTGRKIGLELNCGLDRIVVGTNDSLEVIGQNLNLTGLERIEVWSVQNCV